MSPGASGWRARFVPQRAGAALLSGALMALAHPPFHLLVPSFVALVPLVLWLESLPEGEEGRREARVGGWFFGLVYYTLVFYWLFVALVYYTWLALLAFLAPILILSWLMSWTVGAVHLVRHRLRWPIWLALPVFWTANEWLRANLPQVGFPWMQLGDTLTGYPRLIGAADLVGSRGLSLWLVLVNALVAALVLRLRSGGRAGDRRRAAPLAAALAVAVAGPIGYSLFRWNGLELRPAAEVGVVQPNVPEHLKLEAVGAANDSAIRATETLVRPWVRQRTMDLVLLPETAIQIHLDALPSRGYPGAPQVERWAASLAEALDASVLLGALGARDLGAGEYEPLNSAFLFDPEGGRVGDYDKRYLVPMVERVPFLPPRWFEAIPFMGGFGVGPLVPPFEIDVDAPGSPGSASFGVMICYESIFSPLARHYRRSGADFLVNITNDAWFGRDSWWSRSSALYQHPAHLVMRAVETRMGVARSANTGISEIVDPLGRVSHRTPLFESAAFVATVPTTDVRTAYVQVGDVAGWAAALAALFGLCACLFRARGAPVERKEPGGPAAGAEPPPGRRGGDGP